MDNIFSIIFVVWTKTCQRCDKNAQTLQSIENIFKTGIVENVWTLIRQCL